MARTRGADDRAGEWEDGRSGKGAQEVPDAVPEEAETRLPGGKAPSATGKGGPPMSGTLPRGPDALK